VGIAETAVAVEGREDGLLTCRGGDDWVWILLGDTDLRIGTVAIGIVEVGRDAGKPRGETGVLSSCSVFSERLDASFNADLSTHTVESPSLFSMRVWRLWTEA